MKKRILGILLTLCMALMLVPTTISAEEPAPTITITGTDTVCAQQDYEFTVTAPEGVTLDTDFGYDTGMMGSSADLTVDEDNVGHGVMNADWYDPDTNRFTLSAHGRTADGTPVTGTKTVQVSREHLYVDGVCGCGAVLQYTVRYDCTPYELSIPDGVKTHGEDYTLSSETVKRDGYVQTGWMDGYGNVYGLGDVYTADEDMTFYPVVEQLFTVSAPFTTTVKLGDVGEPGETTFTLEVLGANTGEENYADVTISGSVDTNGAGSYNGTISFTGPVSQVRNMLCEGALVRQVDNGAEGWTVDGTVYGLILGEQQIAARSLDDSAPTYILLIVPTVKDGENYYVDWDAYSEGTVMHKMTFTNTYSAHVYELKYNADGHWDECACGHTQNEEPHKYGAWKVTKEATETAKGEKEHTCTVCGYTETAEIEKLPATETTDPTEDSGTETSPKTGDNSQMALWMALLFVSAAGVIGTTAYGKKRKAVK